MPQTAIEIQQYLSSRAIKGIGPKIAQRIIDEFGDLFLGHTPDIDDDCREVEIQKWLDDHPNVDSFVILDDLDFGFPDVFPENFVIVFRPM